MAAFGVEAIQPQNFTHTLGFATARASADDALLEIWNGPTNADLVYTLDRLGQHQSANGTVSRPSYSFENDKDCGFYRIGANNIGLALNAAKVMDYSTSGVSITGTVTSSGALLISADNGAAIGASGTAFSDLFLASGAVINFNAGDITLTHSSNLLTLGGGNFTAGAYLASADDSGALGASGTAFSDLFLASGGVINFNAGDIIITHSNQLLTFDGGVFSVAQGSPWVVGHSAVTLAGGAAGFLQVVGTTNSAKIGVLRFSANTNEPSFTFGKSRGALGTPGTTVVTGDILGTFNFAGDDGTDMATIGASITITSEGTIGSNRIPTKMVFSTGTDAAPTVLTAALTLDSSQNAVFAGSVDIAAPNTVAGTGLMLTTNDNSVQEIMRDSSSARFKEDIEDAVIDVRAVLAINSKRYGRKGAVGSYLGFIVEDFHDAGFGDILAYDEVGPAGFLEFGRGVTALHHAVLQSQDDRIAALESELTKLRAA